MVKLMKIRDANLEIFPKNIYEFIYELTVIIIFFIIFINIIRKTK